MRRLLFHIFEGVSSRSHVIPVCNFHLGKSTCFNFRSTKNFAKKYNLELTAATFLIVAHSDASMEIACEWQKCIGDTINLVSPLRCGNDSKK